MPVGPLKKPTAAAHGYYQMDALPVPTSELGHTSRRIPATRPPHTPTSCNQMVRRSYTPRQMTRMLVVCGLIMIACLCLMQKPAVDSGPDQFPGSSRAPKPKGRAPSKGSKGSKGKAPRAPKPMKIVGNTADGEEDEFVDDVIPAGASVDEEVARLMMAAEKMELSQQRAKERKAAKKRPAGAAGGAAGGEGGGEGEGGGDDGGGGGDGGDDSGDDEDEDSKSDEDELDPEVRTILKKARLAGSADMSWKKCAETKSVHPTLEKLPKHLPSKMNKSDIFVHQLNHAKLLKGDFAVHRKSVQFLPPNGGAIVNSYRFRSCAVVGNGGGMRLTTLGKSIDSHDVVLRLNQAPTFNYRRFVGTKTTFRLMNRLWTAHYGSGRYLGMNLPMERGLTIVISRSTGHLYDKMLHTLYRMRPDVAIMYLSSRLVSAVRRLLVSYRVRLCMAGYGPYSGGNTPSSGLVAIYLFTQICQSTTVYGFGMDRVNGLKVPYHYYTGTGSRFSGDPVHSFSTEEALVRQLTREELITFCQYDPRNSTEAFRNNRKCGYNPHVKTGRAAGQGADGDEEEGESAEDRRLRREKRAMSIGGSGGVFAPAKAKERGRHIPPARQSALEEADAFLGGGGGGGRGKGEEGAFQAMGDWARRRRRDSKRRRQR